MRWWPLKVQKFLNVSFSRAHPDNFFFFWATLYTVCFAKLSREQTIFIFITKFGNKQCYVKIFVEVFP